MAPENGLESRFCPASRFECKEKYSIWMTYCLYVHLHVLLHLSMIIILSEVKSRKVSEVRNQCIMGKNGVRSEKLMYHIINQIIVFVSFCSPYFTTWKTGKT